MKWHLYKPKEPSTYPQIDCPMVVCFKHYHTGEMEIRLCKKYIMGLFMFQDGGTYCTECYYAYIGYIPNGYKTTYPAKCTRDDRCGYDDDGYCMLEAENQHCKFAKTIPEYSIEEKRIWKEFENNT